MELQEIYEITDIKCVITIDDEWHFDNVAEAILYDALRLSTNDLKEFLKRICITHQDVYHKFNNAIETLHNLGFNIVDKAIGQIYRYISDDSKLQTIKEFSDKDIKIIQTDIEEFGLGLSERGVASLKDFITAARKGNIPLRIYRDFLDSDKEKIKISIQGLIEDDGYALFLIDDQLNGNYRAKEIVDFIKEEKLNDKVACVLVTSKDSQSIEESTNDLFIEYVQKGENIGEQIRTAYIKSLYRIMLRKLEHSKIEAINVAFKTVYQNPNTAFHISEMAQKEGALNFDIILKWIDAQENQHIEKEQSDLIKKFIRYSSVLNSINDELRDVDQGDDPFDSGLYVNDIYDLSVNELYKPIDIGDVFLINDGYYILIGQQCDLQVRENGKRKLNFFEFLSAEPYSGYLGSKEDAIGYENAIINYFPFEQNKMLKINCTRRCYAQTEIFDLCSYNENGEAKLNIDAELSCSIKALMSCGMNKLYNILQEKFKNMINTREIVSQLDSVQQSSINEFIDILSDKDPIIKIRSFNDKNNQVNYNVKRIARLKKHANILYKLYLNHRGREAEEAIFLSRYRHFNYLINDVECEGVCLESTKNRKEDTLHKLDWWIKKTDLNNCLDKLGAEPYTNSDKNEYVQLKGRTGTIESFNYKKTYDQKIKNVKLEISINDHQS